MKELFFPEILEYMEKHSFYLIFMEINLYLNFTMFCTLHYIIASKETHMDWNQEMITEEMKEQKKGKGA